MTTQNDSFANDPVWEDPRITAYVLDELPADERQTVEQQMAAQPALAAAVDEARQVVGDVSSLFAAEEKPTLSDAQREALQSASKAAATSPYGKAGTVPHEDKVLSTMTATDGATTSKRYQFSRGALLIAASVLFLLGLGSGLLLPAVGDGSKSFSLAWNTPDAADQTGQVAATEENRSGVEAVKASVSPQDSPANEAIVGDLPSRTSDESRPTPSAATISTQPYQPASGPVTDGLAEKESFQRQAGKSMGYADASYGEGGGYGSGGYGGGEMGSGGYGGAMGSGYGAGSPARSGSYGGGYGQAMMGGYGEPSPSGSAMSGSAEGETGGYGEGMEMSGPAMQDPKAKKADAKLALAPQPTTSLESIVPQEQAEDSNSSIVNNPTSRVERLSRLRRGLAPLSGETMPADEGHGPGMAGDRFSPITDNAFQRVDEHPLSTFSIDVDTASYAKVRSYLLQQNALPRPDAVRIEELVNYFDYDYAPPEATDADSAADDEAAPPFASHIEFATCPWRTEHRLARIGIKGKEIAREDRPAGNFVFLLDVSGSMNQPNKLPLVKQGMKLLLEQLNEQDRIAVVVYAGAAGLVLDSTPADRLADVQDALERLQAGGSTNGGQGIQLAYNVARDHFIEKGVNRVILCTDGDFNVGTTGTDSLVRMVEEEAKGDIFLSVLGFGMGNHNDAMLEEISGRGNGNYAFIDSLDEAHKVLVEQAAGTLVTIAKDVKIQVEFNPLEVAAYRLIGYENRILAKEDFNDDTKDAGEIGAGHTVTALYEIVPSGETPEPIAPQVDALRYQIPSRTSEMAETGERLTIKLRYKQPDGDKSTLIEFPAQDGGAEFAAASSDFQFAASVAGFGMLLRKSPYQGDWTFAAVEESAAAASGENPSSRRSEFLQMVQKAAELSGE